MNATRSVFAVVGLVLTSFFQYKVYGVPIKLYYNEEQLSTNKFKTEESKSSMLLTKENGLTSFTADPSDTENIKRTIEIMDPEVEIMPSNNQHYYRIRLNKRDTSTDNTYNSGSAIESFESNKKENIAEVRASTIPFLSKGDGDSQTTSSRLPSLPGMSQIPSLSNIMPNSSSTNTPTAIFGGFSIIIMPMPGLSISNIGSALQTGQQISQTIPGMPTLPFPG